MKIIVNPERLSSLSSTFRGEGARLAGSGNDIRRIIGGLDWEVRQKARVDDTFQSANSMSKNICSQADAIAARLNRGATSFRGAEEHAIREISALRANRLFISPPFPRRVVGHFTSDKRDLHVDITDYPKPPGAGYITAEGLIESSWTAIDDWLLNDDIPYNKAVKHFPVLIKIIKSLDEKLAVVPYIGKYLSKVGVLSIIGLAIGTWADYREGMPLRIAFEKNLIETAIGLTGIGAIVLVANAAIQLGGSGLIWLTSEPYKLITDDKHDQMIDNSGLRVKEALKCWDLENLTEDAAGLIDSIYVEPQLNAIEDFRNDPSWGNAGKCAAITFMNIYFPGAGFLLDAEARSHAWESSRSFVGHAIDFVAAPGRFVYEMGRHSITVTEGVTNRVLDTLLPDSMADPITDWNDQVINYINSSPPAPSFAELFNTPPSEWQDKCQEPWDLSK